MTLSGRDVVRSENLARVETRGVELEWDWSPADWLQVGGNTSYTWGAQRLGDRREAADRIPPLQGSLYLTYLHSERLQFDARLDFADGQDRLSARDVRDPRIDPNGTPGWASFDTSVTWRPTSDWRVMASLSNLADRKYRYHGSGIDAVGRNFLLHVQRDWE